MIQFEQWEGFEGRIWKEEVKKTSGFSSSGKAVLWAECRKNTETPAARQLCEKICKLRVDKTN